VAPVAAALHAKGIQVWGWHYVYGQQPVDEAKAAVDFVVVQQKREQFAAAHLPAGSGAAVRGARPRRGAASMDSRL